MLYVYVLLGLIVILLACLYFFKDAKTRTENADFKKFTESLDKVINSTPPNEQVKIALASEPMVKTVVKKPIVKKVRKKPAKKAVEPKTSAPIA